MLIKITLPVKCMLHEGRGSLSSFTSTQILALSLRVNSIVLFVKWLEDKTKLPWSGSSLQYKGRSIERTLSMSWGTSIVLEKLQKFSSHRYHTTIIDLLLLSCLDIQSDADPAAHDCFSTKLSSSWQSFFFPTTKWSTIESHSFPHLTKMQAIGS